MSCISLATLTMWPRHALCSGLCSPLSFLWGAPTHLLNLALMSPIDCRVSVVLSTSPFFLELTGPESASGEHNISKTGPGSSPRDGTHQTSLALKTRGRPSWVSDSHMEDCRGSGLCQAQACPAQQGGAGDAQELPVGAPSGHQPGTSVSQKS